jgi:hypothetical protein
MGASGSAPRGPGARTEHTSATGPFRPCRGRCGPGQTGWAGGGVGKGATPAGVVRTETDEARPEAGRSALRGWREVSNNAATLGMDAESPRDFDDEWYPRFV